MLEHEVGRHDALGVHPLLDGPGRGVPRDALYIDPEISRGVEALVAQAFEDTRQRLLGQVGPLLTQGPDMWPGQRVRDPQNQLRERLRVSAQDPAGEAVLRVGHRRSGGFWKPRWRTRLCDRG